MSELLIREIAQQIINEQFLLNWKFYVVLLGLILITAVISAYLSAYFSKRAEIRAMKSDLNEVLKQLRSTTQAAKEVETAISHTDWVAKEWIVLRRSKLEELLEAIHESSEWIDSETNHRVFDGQPLTQSPISKISRITNLYFPELNDEVARLRLHLRGYRVFIMKTQGELLTAKNDVNLRQKAFDKFLNELNPYHLELLASIEAIELKTPDLLKSIMS